MFEWLFPSYAVLVAGVRVLLTIPGLCGEPVDILRALTLLLVTGAAARVVADVVADRRLRRASPVYDSDEDSALYNLYREAGALAGLRRLPPLHRHADESPLAFTTGSLRPAVFLAPTLTESLAADELRAVLLHELVHVRRRDNLRARLESMLPVGSLVLIVQSAALYVVLVSLRMRLGFTIALTLAAIVLALLWAFRTIVRPRLVFRREWSCDDHVVEALRNPLVVAASLVEVWRLQKALPRRRNTQWAHAHPLLHTSAGVEQRVRRLLDYKLEPRRAWVVATRRAMTAGALVWTTLFLWSYYGSDTHTRTPVPRIRVVRIHR